jgi:hypothetical protein
MYLTLLTLAQRVAELHDSRSVVLDGALLWTCVRLAGGVVPATTEERPRLPNHTRWTHLWISRYAFGLQARSSLHL